MTNKILIDVDELQRRIDYLEKQLLKADALSDLDKAHGILLGWNYCVEENSEGFSKARSTLIHTAMQALKDMKDD